MSELKLTTRGRYAVMAMVELSNYGVSKPMPLSEIANRSNISLSYLEQLIAALRRHGLVVSHRGPGGGYMLAKKPNEIPISDILNAAEDSVPAKRQSSSANSINSQTKELWSHIGSILYASLSKVSLADVLNRQLSKNPYVVKLFDSLK